MDSILFYLISSVLFLATIKESMGIFFIKKDMPYFLSALVWIIFCGAEIAGTAYITIHIFRVFFDAACCLIFCMVLYDGNIKEKAIWIVVIQLLGMLAEMVVGYIFIFAEVEVNRIDVLNSFISKIILIIILVVLKVFNDSKLKRDIPFKYRCIMFAIPLGSIFILNTLFSFSELAENKKYAISALVSSAFVVAINLIVFRIYEKLSDRLELQKQQIIFNKQIELCRHQIQEREESNLKIRNIKHDTENRLICLREYLERQDLDYAKKYVEDLLNCKEYFRVHSYIQSGNIVIDALLNYKNLIMQQMGINLETHIEVPYNFKFNDADICVILGNCLDNSIEAVSKLQNDKVVKVEIIYRKNNLLINILNPYSGNVKKDKLGNFLTTKSDPENHGIGLNSVRKAVKKYNGLVNISTENKIFKVQILLYPVENNFE